MSRVHKITLYAHDDKDDWRWFAEDTADKTGFPIEKVMAIHERKPLYEVGADFDIETGKCLEVRIEGQSFYPRDESS